MNIRQIAFLLPFLFVFGCVDDVSCACSAPMPLAPDAGFLFRERQVTTLPLCENHLLDMLAVLDIASYPDVTEDDVRRAVRQVSQILAERMNIESQLIDVLVVPVVGDRDPGEFVNELLRTRTELPEAVLLFSASHERARTYGGFIVEVSPERPFCNEYRSAVFGQTRYSLVVADWKHYFGTCGYDAEIKELVRSVSANGECRGQADVPCIWNGRYSICQTLVDDPLAAPDKFLVNTIVHELTHPSGMNPEVDHYGTPGCAERIRTLLPTEESETYFGMCPDILTAFSESYLGCPR